MQFVLDLLVLSAAVAVPAFLAVLGETRMAGPVSSPFVCGHRPAIRGFAWVGSVQRRPRPARGARRAAVSARASRSLLRTLITNQAVTRASTAIAAAATKPVEAAGALLGLADVQIGVSTATSTPIRALTKSTHRRRALREHAAGGQPTTRP